MGEEMQTSSVDVQPMEESHVESTPTTETTATETKSEPKSESRFAIETDERTGRRKVVMMEDEPKEPVKEQPKPQETAQETKPYTASEYIQALQKGVVDETRIPMEQAMAYVQYKQQMQAQAQQRQQQVQEQQQEPPNRSEFYNKVEAMAKENALKELGLTEEQLETAEYSDDEALKARVAAYQNALAYNRNYIMEQVQRSANEQQQAQQRQAAMYNDFNTEANKLKASEPNFDEIIKFMYNPETQDGAYKQMGFDNGTRYVNAVQAYINGNATEQQLKDINEYYGKARLAYYAKKNGLEPEPRVSAKVPKVEHPGNSDAKDFTNKKITKAQLSAASGNYKERRAMISQILGIE